MLAYPSVHYYIVLSDFGSSLSINETTSDAEDAGGETGATLADHAGGDSNVLRLAVEGSRRARGILASTYAQGVEDSIDQEIISIGDDCCFRMGVGAADRYLIRGFSWRSDDTTSRGGGILNPWHLRDGTSSSGAKQFRLINTREVAGITEWTAPQGATVVGGSSKTYTFHQNLTTYLDHLGSGTRLGGVLTRIFATRSTGYDDPSAPGVTLSPHGDISAAANALMAVLGEPLDAMVQNLGQTEQRLRKPWLQQLSRCCRRASLPVPTRAATSCRASASTSRAPAVVFLTGRRPCRWPCTPIRAGSRAQSCSTS